MKKLSILALSLACFLLAETALAQSGYWHFPPNVQLNTSTGVASNFPAGSDITYCSSPGYPATVANSTKSVFYAFNACGIFDGSGTQLDYSVVNHPFPIPGRCKHYYAVNWINTWGPPHGNALVLTELDMSVPGLVTAVGSTTLLGGGTMHSGATVSVAALAADGSRKIYATDGSALKSWTVSNSGTIGSATTVATLPALADSRAPLEISPDGTKLFYVGNNSVIMYNVPTGTFTTIAPLSPYIVSGFEYVPSLNRLYVSYHEWMSTAPVGGLIWYDVANPGAGSNNALGGFSPTNTFGFTEI